MFSEGTSRFVHVGAALTSCKLTQQETTKEKSPKKGNYTLFNFSVNELKFAVSIVQQRDRTAVVGTQVVALKL